MFKIAYGAGHNNFVSNGIPLDLHEPFVNEWVLNDRIARYFAQAAAEYEDVQLLRVDDPAGVAPTVLAQRCADANAWGADFFLSIHHNAGINGGKGGGLVGFCYMPNTQAATYRDAIYAACMEAGGIKGDRWKATLEENFYVLRNTNMPAVLMEYGFMDSQTDVPVILTEEYARAMAYATMEGIARVAGLQKRTGELSVTRLPVLRREDRGPTVKAVQLLLMGYGYGMGDYGADGIFGSFTQTVVRAFQKAQNLMVTGQVDVPTWNALLGL